MLNKISKSFNITGSKDIKSERMAQTRKKNKNKGDQVVKPAFRERIPLWIPFFQVNFLCTLRMGNRYKPY